MEKDEMKLKPIIFISGSKATKKNVKETKSVSTEIALSVGLGPFASVKYKIPISSKQIEKKEEKTESEETYLDLEFEEFKLGPAVDAISYGSMPTELTFSPGHPMPDRFYRSHPISPNAYIPLETYDEFLYREREAELIRLLVDLGATKINISEQTITDTKTKGGLDVAGVEASGGVEKSSKQSDSRIFELDGKETGKDININQDSYSWLNYEPSWRAVVHAREVGHCKTASIELIREASFSISASIGLKKEILSKLGISQLGASADHKNDGVRKYMIYAEFLNNKST